MLRRAILICALSLIPALHASGEAVDTPLTVAEYVAEVATLAAAIDEPAGTRAFSVAVNQLPPVWRVRGRDRTFDISTASIRRDILTWQKTQDEALAFDLPFAAPTAARAHLTEILSSREFQDVHGPAWTARLRQRLLEMLATLVGSSAIPTVGRTVIYGLVVLAIVLVVWALYRSTRRDGAILTIAPERLVPSAREWQLWLADAEEAAARGNWRDAVHLGYWCAVSFLEARGAWRPDRARTPREYLRLLPAASDQRTRLAAITSRFEPVWYGARDADVEAYHDVLANLKKMGCPLG